MKTFGEFIADAAQQRPVNFLFERGMHSLMDEVERITTVLRQASVPFEIIGGVATNVHNFGVSRSRTIGTP